MKKALGALLLTSLLSFSTIACDVPEDGETAADRAEVNTKKSDKKAGQKSGKSANKKTESPKETVAQENARRSAATYLDTSPFSRKGLIEQLEFEGYSVKDATYGVDAQKVDWKKQAAASAENYLDTSAFSRSGLIDQLMFEGYTRPQAEYGVNKVGL